MMTRFPDFEGRHIGSKRLLKKHFGDDNVSPYFPYGNKKMKPMTFFLNIQF